MSPEPNGVARPPPTSQGKPVVGESTLGAGVPARASNFPRPLCLSFLPAAPGRHTGTLWLVTASLQDRRDTLNTSLPKVDANLLGAQKQLSPHIPQARPTGNTCFSAINATATGCVAAASSEGQGAGR